MIFYGIRHKHTGEMMPQLKRHGYSHWNPSHPEHTMVAKGLGFPRLLQSKKHAQQCINQWAANPNSKMTYSVSYEGTEDNSVDIKPDGRKKEDLEVVKIELRIRK